MGKSKWKDRPGVEPEPCGCRYQITKATDRPIRDRIKQCADHAPKIERDDSRYGRNEPQIPDGAAYWWP